MVSESAVLSSDFWTMLKKPIGVMSHISYIPCIWSCLAIPHQQVAHGVSPMPVGLVNAFDAIGCGRSVDIVLPVGCSTDAHKR